MTTSIYSKSSNQSAIQTAGIDSLVLDTTGVVFGVDNGFKPFTVTNPSNTLLITLKPCTTRFRSTTLDNGESVQLSNVSDITLTVPVGATLGSTNSVAARYFILEINNAGTKELAIVNQSGGVNLSEAGVISTTAISAASDSASVVYSTTARTGVAYRVLGCIDSTQATAGTYATALSLVQPMGGQALNAMSSLGYGQTEQNFLVPSQRAISTTYYNTTGKPIKVKISLYSNTAGGRSSITANGQTHYSSTAYGSGAYVSPLEATVLAGQSYSYTDVAGVSTVAVWTEIR